MTIISKSCSRLNTCFTCLTSCWCHGVWLGEFKDFQAPHLFCFKVLSGPWI